MTNWKPIETYDEIGKKALFADDDGFIFVGEGTCDRYRGLEFTDYVDYYEPLYWMDLPIHPNDQKLVLTRQRIEETIEKKRGKSINKFNVKQWEK